MHAPERQGNFDRRDSRLAAFSRSRSPYVISALLFLSYVLTIYQISFSIFHSTGGTWPDDLIYFNALQDWLKSGSPLRGYTLQPSPYVLDFLLDRIIIFFTDDFERFAYAVSGIVAILFAGSFLTLGYAFCRDWRRAVVIALLSYTNLYLFLIPMRVRLHLFLPSHTFSSIATPVAIAMLAASLTSASRQVYIRWCVALSLLTAIIVLSDPILIADLIVPATMTCVWFGILLRTRISRLAFSVFTLCASAVFAMELMELCNVFFWPHRVDVYPPVFSMTDTGILQVNGNGGFFAILREKQFRGLLHLFEIAVLGSALWLWIQIRVYRARQPESQPIEKRRFQLMVMTAVGLFAAVTSFALPVLRGSFGTYYEWRYFLLSSMFLSFTVAAAITYAGFAAWSVLMTFVNIEQWWKRLSRIRPRFAAAMGIGLSGIVLFAAIGSCARNSIRVGDGRSPETPFFSCVARIMDKDHLHDGLASAYVAIMLRAGYASPQFRRESKVFQTTFTDTFSYLEPANNNLKWMSKELLQKEGGVDYVVFEGARDSPSMQNNIREVVGEPTAIETCPHPNSFAQSWSNASIWVYKDKTARDRLTNFVLWDNNRDIFFPSSQLGTLVIDPVIGAYSVAGEGGVRQGKRGWSRDTDHPIGRFLQTKPIFLPPGKYRAHICLSTNDRTSQEPLATAEVSWGGTVLLKQDVSRAGPEFVASFDLKGKGGPTSGNATLVTVFAGNVSDVAVCGLTIERYGRLGFFRPLAIFE